MSSTIAPFTLPVIAEIDSRDGNLTKDVLHVNMLLDKDSTGAPICRKRPGITVTATDGSTGQGVHVDALHLYEVRGNNFYVDSVLVDNVGVTTGRCSFADSGNLISPNFTTFHGLDKTVYRWDEGDSSITSTTISSAVTGFVSGYAQLNGTFYVMDRAGNIFGSDILDPSNFDPLNKIVMPLEDGIAIGITRHYDHILAFGSTTMAVFVDAGNSVGSPLQQATNYFRHVGAYSGGSIASVNDEVTWISRNDTGYLKVLRMNGLQAEEVSTEAIEKIMNNPLHTLSTDAFCINLKDRYLYCIRIIVSGGADFILAFDSRYKIWYNWQFSSTTDSLGQHIEDAVFTQSDYDSQTYTTPKTNNLNPWLFSFISYSIGSDEPLFVPISSLIDNQITIRLPFAELGATFTADVFIYSTLLSPDIICWSRNIIQTSIGELVTVNGGYQDLSVDGDDTTESPILCRTRSGETDLATLDLKSIAGIDLLADMTDGGVYFRLTLDDYQSYEGWRFSNLQSRVRLTDLGSFERLAIDICTVDNYPFRLRRIDLKVAKNG